MGIVHRSAKIYNLKQLLQLSALPSAGCYDDWSEDGRVEKAYRRAPLTFFELIEGALSTALSVLNDVVGR